MYVHMSVLTDVWMQLTAQAASIAKDQVCQSVIEEALLKQSVLSKILAE